MLALLYRVSFKKASACFQRAALGTAKKHIHGQTIRYSRFLDLCPSRKCSSCDDHVYQQIRSSRCTTHRGYEACLPDFDEAHLDVERLERLQYEPQSWCNSVRVIFYHRGAGELPISQDFGCSQCGSDHRASDFLGARNQILVRQTTKWNSCWIEPDSFVFCHAHSRLATADLWSFGTCCVYDQG